MVAPSAFVQLPLTLANWGIDHRSIGNVSAYLRELGCYRPNNAVEVLNNLPCERDGQNLRVLISVKEWAAILAEANRRVENDHEFDQAIKLGIQACIKEKGIPIEKVAWPVVAEMLSRLANAPAIIRDSEHSSLEEKLVLHTMLRQRPAGMPEDVALQSLEVMCNDVRLRRTTRSKRSSLAGRTLNEAFEALSQQILKKRRLDAEEEAFGDREQMLRAMIGKMKEFKGKWDGKIGNRPIVEILEEHLRNLPDPAFQLMGSLLCSCDRSATAGRRWLAAAAEHLTGSSG